MTHYQNGATFERAIKASLEEDGYFAVRSAGSKGKVDIVAVKPGQLLFVQAKTDGLISPAERAELLRIARRGEALPIVAYKGTEGRRRPIRYRLLTGTGPKEFQDWSPDVEEES